MLSLTAVALVFAGGFCGGAARYALTRLIRDARAATFAANIAAHPQDWHMLQPFWEADWTQRQRARVAGDAARGDRS